MTDNITRRKFVGSTAGLVGAGAVAGCVGGDDDDTGSNGGNSGNGDNSSNGGDSQYGEITGTFRLRMWHEKYGNVRIQEFADEYGIQAENAGFSSPSEPYSNLQAGQYVGDNISFLHNWGQRAWENDLIQPIDTTRLSNLDNLDDRWRAMNEIGDNEQWGIPYDVGIFPLTYSEDEFSEAPNSWDILWDEAYEGRITMQDSAIQSCQLAALYTGQDPLDPDDFEDIEEALLQQQPLVRAYWGTFERGMRLFVEDSVDVGQLTVGRTVQAAVEHESNINYNVPQQGAMTYFDEFTIPENAEHVGTSYAWIDDYLEQGGAQFTELEKYRATTADLDDQVPEELKGWYEWPQDWDLHTQDLLEDRVRERYDEIWSVVQG